MSAVLPGRDRPSSTSRRRSGRSRAGVIALYTVLIVVAAIYIFPFLIQLATTFKSEADATSHPLSIIPTHPTLAALRVLQQSDFPRWFFNSVFVAVFVTTGRVFFDSLAGYALARLTFRGRSAVMGLIIAVMAVPGVVLLIPKFLILNQLGLFDHYTGMIIPLLADAAGVFIMRQFFSSIPVSIEDAAHIDGAGIFRTYWSIVLPMARPSLITLTVLSFQGSWNELPQMIVARQSPSLDTLPVGVASLVSGQLGSAANYPIKLGAALLMTIPVGIVFFIFQKRFIAGANEGAEKG
jgi:multiple sugar transport system permease protein